MNTCHTSIKTEMLLLCFGSPHFWYQRYETLQWFSDKTKQKGVVKQTNTGFPNTYHDKNTYHSPLIYPHFGIEFLQPPQLLNSEDLENVTHGRFLLSLLNIIQTLHCQ